MGFTEKEYSLQALETKDITEAQFDAIAFVAASGFGQDPNSPSMREDTREHIASADQIQLLLDSDTDRAVGFALYRRLLWQ